MELFELSKIIFSKGGEYKTVTKGDKKKWFFLLSRRFSIKFPMQANILQHMKVNQVSVIDFWHQFLSQKFNKTPGWMYTKGAKKAKEKKEKKMDVSETLISEYAKRMVIDRKSVYDALDMFPIDTVKELKDFEKIINQK